MARVACLAGMCLTLGRIFAQWMRPLVVMPVPDFRPAGAIWGQ